MKRRMWALTATVSAVVTIGGALTGVGLASQPDGPALTNVPTANTKSDGYSPASKLSPELSQVVVAQGSTRLENPSALTSYYGYYNDVLNAAGQPQMLPLPGPLTEAQKSEPDKNTYLVFLHGLPGAHPTDEYAPHSLSRAHKLAGSG